MKKILFVIFVLVLVVSFNDISFAKGKGWKTDESEKYLKWWDSTYKGTDSAVVGGVYYQKGDYSQAVSELEKSVESGSQDGRIYYQLAFAYQQTGEMDKAIDIYKKATVLLDEQDPKHRYAYYARYNLAFMYKDKGDYENAVNVISEALKKNKEPGGYNLLGWLYWKQGKIKEALNQYKTSVKIDPDQEDAQYNLGVLYYEEREINQAKKCFEKVKKLNPEHERALVYLGNLGDEGVLADAKYQDLLIPEPALRYCYKGKILLDEGKIVEAKQEYETAYEISPDSPIVNQGLGVVYEYSDDGKRYGKDFNIEKSIFHYSKALEKDPNLPNAAYNLGVLYSLQGKTDDAITLYTRVLRTQPDYAEVHYNLAVLYDNEKNNPQKARYHYIRYLQLNPDAANKDKVKKRMQQLSQ